MVGVSISPSNTEVENGVLKEVTGASSKKNLPHRKKSITWNMKLMFYSKAIDTHILLVKNLPWN